MFIEINFLLALDYYQGIYICPDIMKKLLILDLINSPITSYFIGAFLLKYTNHADQNT